MLVVVVVVPLVLVAFLAAAVSSVSATAAATNGSSGGFFHGQDPRYLRRLSKDPSDDTTASSNAFRGNGAFVDGTETVYDDFSLAWRFLGFYEDCNVCVQDGGGDDDNENENDNENEIFVDALECFENGKDNTVCRRYALWAAYADNGYEGNGASEYQHYDRH